MMRKIGAKIDAVAQKAKTGISGFIKEEQGDFGIGQIAGIVAGIVIIGVIISVVSGNMDTWIDQVWTWVTELFNQV
jgi:Flp pilus assembly pilin Flp